MPNGDTGTGDINPEVGITSTPVIGSVSTGQVLYVVSKTKTLDGNGNPVYTQQLHALSVTTGAEQLGGPVVIQGSVPGTGDASSGGLLPFNPLIQHNRPGLLLVTPSPRIPQARSITGTSGSIGPAGQGVLYIAYASHGDNGPYHGWVFAYNPLNLAQLGILNTTPNALTDPSGYPLAAGGIWQSGAGLASDGKSVFFSTGNGSFNPSNGSYGDSVVRFAIGTYSIADYFTPSDQLNLDDYDTDLGSGGVMLLPPDAGAPANTTYMVQSGKEGTIYVLNAANLGQYHTTDTPVQELTYVMGGIWGAPAYFNKTVFYGPSYSSLVSFPVSAGVFTGTSPGGYSPTYFGYPGPTPSVSSNGTTNGIVWAIQTDAYGNGGPSLLHAFDATNVATELYNSGATQGRDTLGGAVKFATPTIVNGKVYVGAAGSVGVFGLGTWAATPTVTPSSGNYVNSVTVSVNDTTSGAQIRYTTDGSIPSPTSSLYSTPLTFTASTVFKARAFLGTSGGSAVVENDYLINAVIGNGTGLFGSYYNNLQDPAGNPTAVEIDPVINFNWNGASPITGVAGTNFAAEWTGQIQAETTDTYTLSTESDDGVEVYINGVLVINDYTYHGETLDTATLSFVAGQKYNIVIKYFQGGGGAVMQLLWATNGLPTQIVPQSQLYPGSSHKK